MHYPRSPRELPREVLANDVFTGLRTIIEFQEYIMAAIDDLTAAVTAATASMGSALDAINALRQQLANDGNGVTDTQLEGLASQLSSSTDALNGVLTAAMAGTPPAAPGTSGAANAPTDAAPAA